jgi:hypothetical protein
MAKVTITVTDTPDGPQELSVAVEYAPDPGPLEPLTPAQAICRDFEERVAMAVGGRVETEELDDPTLDWGEM